MTFMRQFFMSGHNIGFVRDERTRWKIQTEIFDWLTTAILIVFLGQTVAPLTSYLISIYVEFSLKLKVDVFFKQKALNKH